MAGHPYFYEVRNEFYKDTQGEIFRDPKKKVYVAPNNAKLYITHAKKGIIWYSTIPKISRTGPTKFFPTPILGYQYHTGEKISGVCLSRKSPNRARHFLSDTEYHELL